MKHFMLAKESIERCLMARERCFLYVCGMYCPDFVIHGLNYP